jgi:hypothetical protein
MIELTEAEKEATRHAFAACGLRAGAPPHNAAAAQ